MSKARLTDPMIELLSDIANNPLMFLRRWSRWAKTGQCLVDRGLATMKGCGPGHSEIVITEEGRAEADRRGLIKPPGAEVQP